jgi:hypothetical protein
MTKVPTCLPKVVIYIYLEVLKKNLKTCMTLYEMESEAYKF